MRGVTLFSTEADIYDLDVISMNLKMVGVGFDLLNKRPSGARINELQQTGLNFKKYSFSVQKKIDCSNWL